MLPRTRSGNRLQHYFRQRIFKYLTYPLFGILTLTIIGFTYYQHNNNDNSEFNVLTNNINNHAYDNNNNNLKTQQRNVQSDNILIDNSFDIGHDIKSQHNKHNKQQQSQDKQHPLQKAIARTEKPQPRILKKSTLTYDEVPLLSTRSPCNMDHTGNYEGCQLCTEYKPTPELTNRTLTKRYELQSFIETVVPYDSVADKYFIPDSRGIVSSVGTAWDAESAYSQIYQLRYYFNETIPIQLFHLPDEITLVEKMKLLSLPNVEVIDLTDKSLYAPASDTGAKGRKYFVKPTAIINSKFEHAMWLDSDNILLKSPVYLFDLPQYTNTTALFWPDNYLWNMNSENNPPNYFWTGGVFSHNPIFQVLQIPCIRENAGESGQMIVNKRLAWTALNTVNFMASDHHYYMDELELLGDKDLFRLTWRALSLPYFMIRMSWHLAGFMHHFGQSRFCGLGMVQHDPNDNVVFLHANGLKTQTHIGWSVSPFTHLNRYTTIANDTRFGGNGCGLELYANSETSVYTEPMTEQMLDAFESYKRGASNY